MKIKLKIKIHYSSTNKKHSRHRRRRSELVYFHRVSKKKVLYTATRSSSLHRTDVSDVPSILL